jgi:hypothetical protein
VALSKPINREDPLALPPAPDWMVAGIGRLTGWDVDRCRRVLQSATTEEYLAAGGERPLMDESHDPLELDAAFAAALLRATLEAEALADRRYGRGEMGYCHDFWSAKQQILWSRYGLRWQSPAELNPEMEFD